MQIQSISFTKRLTAIVITAVVAALGLVAVFAYYAMSAVDAASLLWQSRLIQNGIEKALVDLPSEQESITIWDDAVLESRAGNMLWMEENVGVWMADYFGHDAAYVLDPQNQPRYAMQNGQTVAAQVFGTRAPQLSPLIDKLRAEISSVPKDAIDATTRIGELEAVDYILLDDKVAMASVKAIVPSSDRLTQPAGSEYLHIAIRYVGPELLSYIGAQYSLDNVRLVQLGEVADSLSLIPLRTSSGDVKGHVTWQAYRPGLKMIQDVAPGMALATVIGLLLLTFLLRRIRNSSAELVASEAQAQFLAFHDPLTGLPNRALFDDRLSRALAAARSSGSLVALHAMDLDRFKNINDTLGHPGGDSLIQQVALRLSAVVRETDTVARLGGDEFAIVQCDITDDKQAEDLASRVLHAITEPFDLLGEPAVVSTSVGIALSNGSDASPQDMLRKADIALYEAKGRGRDRYELFAGDMDDVVKQRRLIERELRHALEQGEQLKVLYQPLYSVSGTDIVGAEALVRWDHPVHGRLSPQLFIAIAEERGLIEPLGEWVLQQACMFAISCGLPWVAVNVSPIQFRNARFPSRVASILERTGLSAARLQLEITEGVLLDHSGIVDASLKTLRNMGVRIALDDFGTGYSSMSYLREYAVDKLKIDRSFVSQIGTSPDSDAIIAAIVALAHALRLEVTAEGVETTIQKDHLASIGCNEFQGFLLSKPITDQELRGLLDGRLPDSSSAVAV